MKKAGITIIETMVALMIVTGLIPIATSIAVNGIRSFEIRNNEEEIERVIFCVMEEIKYNYSIDELKNRAINDAIKLEYNDEFLKELVSEDLLDFPKGEDIRILIGDKVSDDSINITIEVKNFSTDEYRKRTFIKSKWMEYEV